MLQTLLVALLVGFALQPMGRAGEPILRGVEHLQRLVFRVLAMIMWAAPVGAFGAIAGVVGETGVDALKSLAVLMFGFYVTCALFVFVVLGTLLRLATGVNIFSLLQYLGREFLLIVSTSSSESALPRLIAKMEHAGVDKPTVGVVVPTGYSFNLDGTAIYLTMASLFIAEAMGNPLSIGEQICAAAVHDDRLEGRRRRHRRRPGHPGRRPELAPPRAGRRRRPDRRASTGSCPRPGPLTNFAGNAVATVLIGHWTGGLDRPQLRPGPRRRRPVRRDHDARPGRGGAARGAAAAAPSGPPVGAGHGLTATPDRN